MKKNALRTNNITTKFWRIELRIGSIVLQFLHPWLEYHLPHVELYGIWHRKQGSYLLYVTETATVRLSKTSVHAQPESFVAGGIVAMTSGTARPVRCRNIASVRHM